MSGDGLSGVALRHIDLDTQDSDAERMHHQGVAYLVVCQPTLLDGVIVSLRHGADLHKKRSISATSKNPNESFQMVRSTMKTRNVAFGKCSLCQTICNG